jgi:hypothetical protein
VPDVSYRIAPIFLIRMAGAPFDAVEKLATTGTARAARELIARQTEFSQARAEVERLITNLKPALSKEQFRLWRKAIRSGVRPISEDPPSSAFAVFWQTAERVAAAEAVFHRTLENELSTARDALFDASRRLLPAYMVFAAGGVRERVIHQLSGAPQATPPRNKQARADERHLLLYLQRVAAKNDSLSAFGPEGWGRVEGTTESLAFSPDSGIARRETFLERWTAHGIAAAINGDPEAAVELAPRLQPNGRLEQDGFVFTETGATVTLDATTRALLARCNGTTPAHSLGANIETLVRLAQQDMILWKMEVPAFASHPVEVLISDISRWRAGPAQRRWLDELRPLAALPEKFAATTETLARLGLINQATARLEKLGAHKTASRFLYSATNPIGEECFRECNFSISEDLINEVALEAASWIDFWRDNYAFVASRVADGLRRLLKEAPLQSGALPFPAFLRHCAMQKMPLTGPGMVAFAHLAFQEVKTAFRENLGSRIAATEYELTAADCHLVRRQFDYPKFDEYTYPSADLQLAAQSVAAVQRGEYQWILAELHPPAALLHHGFYWSCPDKPALSRALEAILFRQPSFQFGFFAADFTATTAVRLFEALPDLTYFVAPQRGLPGWQMIAPAETEVFVNPENNDVALRERGSHRYLGSFARAWIIPLGFHPFSFSLGAHTPRLRCGKVVVQRETWLVALDELGAGDFTGVSRDLVFAVERLRAARRLPRHVYIRPSEQALRRSGAEGRDKDTKPVFIDFESYLFLEIFHRWLTKAGELEITEMLPTPDQLLWQEQDGRRTFELRTQIIPR